MEIIESRYKNDGYAVWFKLLEALGAAEGHLLNFSDEIFLEHFSGVKCHISAPETLQIIDFFSRLGAIDRPLWEHDKVVWCQHFVDRLEKAYKKRKLKIPPKPDLRSGNGIDSPETPPQSDLRHPKSTKESIGEESKVKERKKDIPAKEKFIDYVFLTPEEHERLKVDFGVEGREALIAELDNYIGSNPKKRSKMYTDHNRVLRGWVAEKLGLKKSNGQPKQNQDTNPNYEPGIGEIR